MRKKSIASQETDRIPLDITREHTNRGFNLLTFQDYYGAQCSIQESSLALCDEPGAGALWIGVDKPSENAEEITRMHLTWEQVEDLVKELQHWLDHQHLNMDPNRHAKIRAAAEKFNEKHGEAMQRLADSGD